MKKFISLLKPVVSMALLQTLSMWFFYWLGVALLVDGPLDLTGFSLSAVYWLVTMLVDFFPVVLVTVILCVALAIKLSRKKFLLVSSGLGMLLTIYYPYVGYFDPNSSWREMFPVLFPVLPVLLVWWMLLTRLLNWLEVYKTQVS